MTINEVREELKASLSKFLGEHNSKKIREEVKLATQKLLAKNEAVMYGFEITSCNSLWGLFSLKQKAMWYWNNKITKNAAVERLKIDLLNDSALRAAQQEAEQQYLDDYEGWEWEDYYTSIQYPDWAQSNPKSILKTEVKIKPTQGIDYISVDLKMEGLEAQIGKSES